MSNDLSILGQGLHALTTAGQDLAALDSLSKSAGKSDFTRRVKLFVAGKNVDLDQIKKGNFGFFASKEDLVDLGQSMDVLVIARKAKAVDLSDTSNVIVENDVNSPEFQRIMADADVKDSGCSFGPCYLLYERTTDTFLEFFCGNKTARYESSVINSYLPTADHGPKPMTLGRELIEKGRFSWFGPKASDCITPFSTLPEADRLVAKVEDFLKPEGGFVSAPAADGERRSR